MNGRTKPSEFESFTNLTESLLKAPHSDLKEKLYIEKAIKNRKSKRASRA